jgi:hypothetical protein
MALVIGAKVRSEVLVSGGYVVRVLSIPEDDTFNISVRNKEARYLKTHTVKGDSRIEIIPDVFLSAGDSGSRNSLARMVFEAPKDIRINRNPVR